MAFDNLNTSAARTRIRVQRPIHREDGAGGETDRWEDIFVGTLAAVWRRKLTRFDSSVDGKMNRRIYAPETATVSVRYTNKITPDCRVWRSGDTGGAWDIIGTPERSIDGGWLEFTVERKVRSV